MDKKLGGSIAILLSALVSVIGGVTWLNTQFNRIDVRMTKQESAIKMLAAEKAKTEKLVEEILAAREVRVYHGPDMQIEAMHENMPVGGADANAGILATPHHRVAAKKPQ